MTSSSSNERSQTDRDLRTRIESLEAGGRNGAWWRRTTVVVIALAVSVPLAVDALDPAPHEFVSGGVISADEMNANFEHLQNGITAVESAVPSGAVMFFDLPTCPVGWSDVEEARGRALVGMNGSAGTLRGTVGDALTDTEDRVHTHSVDVGMFNSGDSAVPHRHSIPATDTDTDGEHNHQWWNSGSSYGSSGGLTPLTSTVVAPGAGFTVSAFHSSDLYTSETTHSHHLDAWNTGEVLATTTTSHHHSVNPPSQASSVASTSDVLPYVQFLVCRRD